MHPPSPSPSVLIAPRQVVALHNACGTRISSRGGCVWLTQSGDARDVVLRPGESFRLDRAGTAVMTSARGADVTIAPPPGRPVAVALRCALRGLIQRLGVATGRLQTGPTLGRTA